MLKSTLTVAVFVLLFSNSAFAAPSQRFVGQRCRYTAGLTGAVERDCAAKEGDLVNALDFTGADIGAKVNAAWVGCGNACTVYVPAGAYSYSTTINFPMASNGTAGLRCDAGATLSYTGSGHGIDAAGTGQPYANVTIDGCRVVGTSSGVSGIHLRAFNRGTISNTTVRGFTTGDGIKNEGANTIDLVSVVVNGNKNGIHNLGIVVSATNYAANAVRMIGGQATSNTGWGAWEDGALSATVGPNIGNNYIGVVFQSNGTNGVATSGHLFIQRVDQAVIQGSYFEYVTGETKTQSITVGDATYLARGVSIRNSWFGSVGATTTIKNTNGQGTFVGGNTEAAAITNFLTQAVTSSKTTIEGNSTLAVVTPFVGTDAGDTVWWGAGTSLQNAMSPGARGYQFNSLSGLDRDLEVRTRNGGTYATKWLSAGAGSTIAAVDDNGQGVFLGGLLVGTSVVNSGTGLQHKRVAGCATAAAAGSVCTTAVAWVSSFANTNYTVVCTGDLLTSGVPLNGGITAKAVGSVTFQTVAATGVAAQYTNIDCVAFHD